MMSFDIWYSILWHVFYPFCLMNIEMSARSGRVSPCCDWFDVEFCVLVFLCPLNLLPIYSNYHFPQTYCDVNVWNLFVLYFGCFDPPKRRPLQIKTRVNLTSQCQTTRYIYFENYIMYSYIIWFIWYMMYIYIGYTVIKLYRWILRSNMATKKNTWSFVPFSGQQWSSICCGSFWASPWSQLRNAPP